jgi:proteasome lid subunit RPN8/RPN11
MQKYLNIIEAMGKHSLAEYPNECVGIITKDFEYVPCKNISDNPKITFFLEPAALVKYDGNIWGIFHSHPGEDTPIPSKEDKISAAFNEYRFIVGFKDKFYIYWLDKDLDILQFMPLEEKHFAS